MLTVPTSLASGVYWTTPEWGSIDTVVGPLSPGAVDAGDPDFLRHVVARHARAWGGVPGERDRRGGHARRHQAGRRQRGR